MVVRWGGVVVPVTRRLWRYGIYKGGREVGNGLAMDKCGGLLNPLAGILGN